MNITRKNIDDLNAIVTVEVAKADYEPNVEKVIENYRKNANIPGFRKGAVPMSLIRKQYGKAIKLEEVNKILQEKLNEYLQDEKIELLGNPLPKDGQDFDIDADAHSFDFELGLAPKFDIDLSGKNDIVQYKITADDKMVNDQVMHIRNQYGRLVPQEAVTEESDVTGTFANEEKGIHNRTSITPSVFKDKKAAQSLIGKKVGDVVTFATKGLFDDDHKLMDYLKVSHDDVHGLDVNVDFTIDEITASEPAELSQEFFDKLFGPGNVTSETELKARIKADAEKQFEQQADQKFLNDVTEHLIKSTKFDLPAEFLKKWIQTSGEQPLSADEAANEYEKSENGLRYQLIEGKLIADNNLKLTLDELKAYTGDIIRKQMAQFGQTDPSDADVDGIVARVLSNQDEARRISEQVMSQKMLNLFKINVKAKSKEVTYDQFIKEMYGE
jgi:trigger factor